MGGLGYQQMSIKIYERNSKIIIPAPIRQPLTAKSYAVEGKNMSKLEREAMATYLDSTFKRVVASASWVLVGDDIEDMSVELNPDTETTKKYSRADQNER